MIIAADGKTLVVKAEKPGGGNQQQKKAAAKKGTKDSAETK